MAADNATGTQPTRVMLVDDHEVVRAGVAELIARTGGIAVVAEAGTVADAITRAELVAPDVIVVDLQLRDGTGIDVIRRLKQTRPATRAVVLTSFSDDDALVESQQAGASAFLLKTARGTEIVETIKAVAAGRRLLDEKVVRRRSGHRDDPTAMLTPSERRVVDLIGDGLSNREIGERLGIAEKTVKNHITSLLAKMGLQRRTQVAAWVAGQRPAAWRP